MKKFFTSLILSILILLGYNLILNINLTYASSITNVWTDSSKILPNKLANQGLVADNGTLFLIGGSTNDDYSQVYSSDLLNDGSLSNWESTSSSLPETRYFLTTASKDNNIYVLGGALWNGQENYKNSVYLGTVQSGNSIPSWQSLNSLPAALGVGGAVITNNTLYYIGGSNDSGKSSTIYYAGINSDGTIGNWVTDPTPLPKALDGFGIVAKGNNIFVIGGRDDSGDTDTVYKITVNPGDGSVSAIQTLAPLPIPIARGGMILVGSTIISVGGETQPQPGNPAINIDSIYSAQIDNNGNLSLWTKSDNSLPAPVGSGAVTYANGYIYVTGGYGVNDYLDTVYYAKVNTLSTLNVPSYKQTDSQWANLTYDSANLWAPVGKTTINRWGCALTSAVMLLRYYGITALPNGSDLNPASLNTWLLAQKHGYVGNGNVNWVMISSLSKLAKSKNPNFAYDMLEFDPFTSTEAQLTSDIQNNQPDIVGVENDNHFVIATGIDNATFSINDPYANHSDLSSYGNTISSLKRFIPAHSDGSYIELFVDPGITITVKNQNNQIVGGQFTQQPLIDDIGGEKSGDPLNVYYVKKPDSGTYTVTLSASTLQPFTLLSDLFDVNAQDTADSYTGILSNGNSETVLIHFDKNTAQNSTIDPVITYASFIKDIQELNKQKAFHTKGFYTSLLALATVAQKGSNLHNTDVQKQSLKAFITELNVIKKNGITPDGYTILSTDAQNLLNNL